MRGLNSFAGYLILTSVLYVAHTTVINFFGFYSRSVFDEKGTFFKDLLVARFKGVCKS